MIPKLDLSTSTHIDILGLSDELTWPAIIFEHYENDGTTPLPITGEWKFYLLRQGVVVEILDEDTGVTVEDNVLTIQKPADLSIPAKTYEYNILNKRGEDTFLIYKGSLIVNNTQVWQ